MTKRTRYFMFGSALVGVVVLCTGLVAYYNGGLGLLRSASAAPDDLNYMPSDAAAVAFANVHDVMNSQFRQKLRQILPSGEEKDKLLNETGIDLEHDIDSVVASFAGQNPTNGDGVVVLVRGRFDAARIEGLATQHGGVVETYKNRKLLVGVFDDAPPAGAGKGAVDVHGHGTAGLAFAEPNVLILGRVDAVKRALDAHDSGNTVTKNTDLMRLVAEMDRSQTAWVVGQFDAISHAASLPVQAKDQLAAVQWLAAGAHINGGVSGMIRAEARDDQAAENLRDVVRGALAAARLMSGSARDAKVDAVVNSLQLTGTGKTVGLSFMVPQEILDVINAVAGLKNLGKS